MNAPLREARTSVDPRTERTPDSDVPPADWRDHPEGFEDGYFEDWDDGDEPSGAYPEDEGW
jgi:hypothetical protein